MDMACKEVAHLSSASILLFLVVQPQQRPNGGRGGKSKSKLLLPARMCGVHDLFCQGGEEYSYNETQRSELS